MSGTSSSLAVFDLDGTITTKDTYLEFIKYVKGTLSYYIGLGLLSPFIIAFYLKALSNDQLKEKFFKYYFGGMNQSTLRTLGDRYSESEIPKITRNGAVKVLNWHKAQGHTILILSASADIWLKKWCDINKFKLICTKFNVENETFTGKLKGKNCFGQEKKILLNSFLDSNNFHFTYGYGDSSADKFFLEIVDEPYLMVLNEENVHKFWRAADNT